MTNLNHGAVAVTHTRNHDYASPSKPTHTNDTKQNKANHYCC